MRTEIERSLKIGEALAWGEKKLLQAGIRNAGMEALWLLQAGRRPNFGTDRQAGSSEILLDGNEFLNGPQKSGYQKRIEDRSNRIPLAYILGTQEFMGLELFVTPDVLIPRPETEILVRETLKRISRKEGTKEIADIGTGSGNISVWLAKELQNSKITAVDLSKDALTIARKNALIHGVEQKIKFVRGNLLGPLKGTFDAVVSNPPYIKSSELRSLQKEIRFEPQTALDGGGDGFGILKPLIRKAAGFLKRGGLILVEIGYDQAEAVRKIMKKSGYESCEMIKDGSGIDRVAIGTNA